MQTDGCCEGCNVSNSTNIIFCWRMVVIARQSFQQLPKHQSEQVWTFQMDLSWSGIPQMPWTVQTTSSLKMVILPSWPPGLNCDLVLSTHPSARSFTQLHACTTTAEIGGEKYGDWVICKDFEADFMFCFDNVPFKTFTNDFLVAAG